MGRKSPIRKIGVTLERSVELIISASFFIYILYLCNIFIYIERKVNYEFKNPKTEIDEGV